MAGRRTRQGGSARWRSGGRRTVRVRSRRSDIGHAAPRVKVSMADNRRDTQWETGTAPTASLYSTETLASVHNQRQGGAVMEWWQAVVLGVVEGVTEYLPV